MITQRVLPSYGRLVTFRNGWLQLLFNAVVIAFVLLFVSDADGGWSWTLLIPAAVVVALSAFNWRRSHRQ